MAEGEQGRGAAAGRLTKPLAAVAVAAVAGFLYWLYVTAEPTTVAVVQREAEDTAFAAVAPTNWATFASGPQSYVGMRLRFDGIRVASRLGTAAFWTTLPNETPFLVRLDSALMVRGMSVTSGDLLRVVGMVREMSDSVLDDWQARGVLADDMQRAEAEFATLFLEADRAELRPRPGAGQDEETGGAAQGQPD